MRCGISINIFGKLFLLLAAIFSPNESFNLKFLIINDLIMSAAKFLYLF